MKDQQEVNDLSVIDNIPENNRFIRPTTPFVMYTILCALLTYLSKIK